MSVPSKAKSGQVVHLSGNGFSPGTKIKIVFGTASAPGGDGGQVVGSTVAAPNGQFHASVVVPKSRPGRHVLKIEGTSSAGKPTSWASGVIVLADVAQPLHPGTSLARPVLLSLSVALPIATWVVLGIPSRRRRPRAAPGSRGTTRS